MSSSEVDAMIDEYLQLLRCAGLEHAEVIRPLPVRSLALRLAVAGSELAIIPKEPRVLVGGILKAVETKKVGKLSEADLRELWRHMVYQPAQYDLPGDDEFPIWGKDPVEQDRLPGTDELPADSMTGNDDFGIWTKGEKESEG
jgi:hypothetical protein